MNGQIAMPGVAHPLFCVSCGRTHWPKPVVYCRCGRVYEMVLNVIGGSPTWTVINSRWGSDSTHLANVENSDAAIG